MLFTIERYAPWSFVTYRKLDNLNPDLLTERIHDIFNKKYIFSRLEKVSRQLYFRSTEDDSLYYALMCQYGVPYVLWFSQFQTRRRTPEYIMAKKVANQLCTLLECPTSLISIANSLRPPPLHLIHSATNLLKKNDQYKTIVLLHDEGKGLYRHDTIKSAVSLAINKMNQSTK